MAGVPVHVPFDAVSVWPSRAVPEIVGGAVFTGGLPATTPVCAEVALALPPAFVPVTTTRSVPPTSPATCVYVEAVAPAMSAQAAPAALQRRHW